MQKTVYKSSHKKAENKNMTELLLFIKSIIIQAVIFITVCIVSLFMDVDTEMFFAVCLCTFGAGSFLSGFIIGRTKRKNGLVNGIVYSLPATALFPFISLCLNGFEFDFTLFLSLLCMVVFSAAGGVISVNIKKKAKIKK